MHEQRKIAEAAFFLQHMESALFMPSDFEHFLSAFLSAARSVLQYALEEARLKAGGEAWYVAQVTGNPVLKFFKDRRDANIHVSPAALNREISVTDTFNIGIAESVLVKIKRADGTEESKEVRGEPAAPALSSASSRAQVKFVFVDWSGPDDVQTLSRNYLTQLRAFVVAGVQGRWISG
jgi:hypothetical protein